MKQNPFNRNRAEQMGETSWKYFVREPFSNLLSEKPLIFEGSRGCGKTMFFLCNSWKEVFSEYETNKQDINELFGSDKFIAFYYKVDGKFVGKNLTGKGVEDWEWQTVFNTYFNVIITKEIFSFLNHCIVKGYIQTSDISETIQRISNKIEKEDTTTLEKLLVNLDKILDEVECFSNDPEKAKPIGLHAGTLVNLTLENIRKIPLFSSSRFHVFIDEFEELNQLQQKQLNTLLKQSKYWLVYDIGVKTNGRYTNETMSGEIIQEPHDFQHYYPEVDSYERRETYKKLLSSICKKRLEDYFSGDVNDENYTDITYYLKDYGNLEELDEFSKSSRFNHLKKELQKIIEENIKGDKTEVIEALVNKPPDIVRMHLSLLKRNGKVNVDSLYKAAINETKQYRDWKHNMLFATHFLLCKELDIVKKYSGFTTYAMLSSGVIRSFLEICESAFEYAFSKGFTFDSPRPLTLEEQTEAAHYVSQSKVSKIEGFIPDGILLKRFILALGKIFYLKHTDPDSTLGEPEPNHFFTKTLDLQTVSEDAKRVLDNAVMHNVLQLDLPTKEKNAGTLETSDYHINHIYCPYFKISHRRKRKIYIEPNDLSILLLGKSNEIDKVIRSISKKPSSPTVQGKLNFESDDPA